MQFTEDMKIGIPHIDAQHKEMIDFVDKASSLCISDPDIKEMQECMDFLGNYVVKHFSDEEKLQVESKYPRYLQHRAIHQEFVRTFTALYGEFEKNGVSEKLSAALSSSVTNWIITHIKQEDITFGKYYTKEKLSHLETYAKH